MKNANPGWSWPITRTRPSAVTSTSPAAAMSEATGRP